jgi:hypothetical protein
MQSVHTSTLTPLVVSLENFWALEKMNSVSLARGGRDRAVLEKVHEALRASAGCILFTLLHL